MVVFLHTADWQLGMTRHFLEGEAQGRFTQDRFDAVARIGKVADERGAAFIVVAGDLFEDNHVTRQTVARAMDALSKIKVPVYILPGNHDPLDGASIYHSKGFQDRCSENVHVITDSKPIEVAPGVDLIGAPWYSKRPLRDLVRSATESLTADGRVRIVVGHGAVDRLDPDRDNVAAIRLADMESHLQDGSVHYIALGDRHSVTAVGQTGRIWYSGAHVATGYRDFEVTKPNQVLVVDVDDVQCQVEPTAVGDWLFHRESFVMNGASDIAAFETRVESFQDKPRTVLKAGFVGALSMNEHARLAAIIEHATDLLAAYEPWTSNTSLVITPTQADIDAMNLQGFARSTFDRLTQIAVSSGPEAEAAREGMSLLYRLSKEADA